MWPTRHSRLNTGKNWFVLSDRFHNSGAIDVKINEFVLEKKLSLRYWHHLLFLNWIEALAFSLLKQFPSEKIEELIRFMKFLLSKAALYHYKSFIRSCIEYCVHVWTGASSCYFNMLDKLHKQVCTTVDLSLAASLESLTHRRNVASLSIFQSFYFGRYSYELVELVPFPHFPSRFTQHYNGLHYFSVTISTIIHKIFEINSNFHVK